MPQYGTSIAIYFYVREQRSRVVINLKLYVFRLLFWGKVLVAYARHILNCYVNSSQSRTTNRTANRTYYFCLSLPDDWPIGLFDPKMTNNTQSFTHICRDLKLRRCQSLEVDYLERSICRRDEED